MTALMAGIAVFLISAGFRQPATSTVVAPFVGSGAVGSGKTHFALPEESVLWSGIGAVLGAMLVPIPWALGLLVGGGVGLALEAGLRRRARARRRRQLGFELPAIADLLGLYVLSGESVLGAMRRVCVEASGVAATELGGAIDSVDEGSALVEAVRDAARRSSHPDGARLYELLAQAHRSGARLVDALEIFAADRRSSIAREMTEEGGRRALVGYGPILGLMIPTTLAFLIYPTLAGLDALAAAP
ncbi:MAG: type II secretion system F family protein [Acidimicrobiia bacterium]